MRVFSVLACVSVLAGCGSSSAIEDALDTAVAAQAMLDRIDDLSTTQEFRVPTSGTARFEGFSEVSISTSPFTETDDVLMVGRSALDVSYDGPGAVTGQVFDLGALVGGAVSSEFRDVSGTIEIGRNTSSITGNQWVSDYEGDLDWGTNGATIDGNLAGAFGGNRVSDPDNPIKAIVGADFAGSGTTESGSSAEVVLTVFGEDVR